MSGTSSGHHSFEIHVIVDKITFRRLLSNENEILFEFGLSFSAIKTTLI